MSNVEALPALSSTAVMSDLCISNIETDDRRSSTVSGQYSPIVNDDPSSQMEVLSPAICRNRPPTPAPSPTPEDDDATPSWGVAAAEEDFALRAVRGHFAKLKTDERQRFLTELLNMCTSYELASVATYVSPRLKKDFLKCLPVELALKILNYIDDPLTMARAAQVSKYWHSLLGDDLTWKRLCRTYRYRRLSTLPAPLSPAPIPVSPAVLANDESPYFSAPQGLGLFPTHDNSRINAVGSRSHRPHPTSYKSHFKQRYMIDSAWKHGGTTLARHITEDLANVTWSSLTPKYIVLGLDNSKIYVFARDGRFLRTLVGHELGVWTLDVDDDTLCSGGCDKVLRVWDLTTGHCSHVMRGHSSTIRCIEIADIPDEKIVVSGSRDATIRVWDYSTGVCKHVLVGHSQSVRCLKVYSTMVASGSYDNTCRLWSITDGTCIRVFTGHQSQIYSIAFKGSIICTGSLDSSIRVWQADTGACLGRLTGHTSLVGQLQMRYPILVTGGPDGSIRIWNLRQMRQIHHLAGHDNSVTTIQFDDKRIISGSSDGLTKLWDLETGRFIRQLTEQSQQVSRVIFEDDCAVVTSLREERSCLEVISFHPDDQAGRPLATITGPDEEHESVGSPGMDAGVGIDWMTD